MGFTNQALQSRPLGDSDSGGTKTRTAVDLAGAVAWV